MYCLCYSASVPWYKTWSSCPSAQGEVHRWAHVWLAKCDPNICAWPGGLHDVISTGTKAAMIIRGTCALLTQVSVCVSVCVTEEEENVIITAGNRDQVVQCLGWVIVRESEMDYKVMNGAGGVLQAWFNFFDWERVKVMTTCFCIHRSDKESNWKRMTVWTIERSVTTL